MVLLFLTISSVADENTDAAGLSISIDMDDDDIIICIEHHQVKRQQIGSGGCNNGLIFKNFKDTE